MVHILTESRKRIVRAIIASRSGKLVSFTVEEVRIKNNPEKTKMVNKVNMTCENGHEFSKELHSFLLNQAWCRQCEVDVYQNELERIITERGGELQSKFVASTRKVRVWCGNPDHPPWDVAPNGIRYSRGWCPLCSNRNLNEEICRAVFVEAFRAEFNRTRSAPFAKRLELDGYNEEYKVAFEYNGIQHYRYTKYFHRDMERFEQQQERDRKKIKRCEKAGVDLIVITYEVPVMELRNYIREKLKELRWRIYRRKCTEEEFIQNIRHTSSRNLIKYNEIKKIVEDKGGKLLSDRYTHSQIKVTVKCSVEEHPQWDMVPASIKMGNWCNLCSVNSKMITDEEIQKRLDIFGWKFVRSSYEIYPTSKKARSVIFRKCDIEDHRLYSLTLSKLSRFIRMNKKSSCHDCQEKK